MTFDSTIYCGKCDACASGAVNLCKNRKVVGVSPVEYKQHGAFAELLAVPARILYKLPDNLSYERAAMVEPVSIALHAVGRINLKNTQSAVVVGSGMIGLLVIQALRVAGIETIIAVDLDTNRLELARSLGATHTVVSDGNALQEIQAITGGSGTDTAFEVVGITPTVDLATRSLRLGGSLVLVGNLSPVVEMPLQVIVTRELTVTGSCASAGEYARALDLIASGQINVDAMIAEVAPLEDGIEWFCKLSGPGGSKYMKVILQP